MCQVITLIEYLLHGQPMDRNSEVDMYYYAMIYTHKYEWQWSDSVWHDYMHDVNKREIDYLIIEYEYWTWILNKDVNHDIDNSIDNEIEHWY